MVLNVNPRLCLLCRGAKELCGYAYCPMIAKYTALLKIKSVISRREFFCSSPPSVFVGRYGYPVVSAGPLAPPLTGDTSVYDLPERWLSISLEEVLNYRLSLISARGRVKVKDVRRSRLISSLQELVLSLRPVDVEVKLLKPPRPAIELSEYQAPMGPKAPLKEFKVVSSGSYVRQLEYVYGDTDLGATEAIIKLYRSGIPVTHIQRMLSVGALGRGKYRKLVPTRWAITAVDQVISSWLIKEVRRLPLINEYRVYVRRYSRNLFLTVLIPGRWSFEWMEAWYPNSTWNPSSNGVAVEGDYEGFRGRTTYPSIGGCYYAARLATAEHLINMGRQATAVALREIYPGFKVPIGVWFVRENLRYMYSKGPVLKTQSFREVLDFLDEHTDLGARRWVKESYLLKSSTLRTLMDYLGWRN